MHSVKQILFSLRASNPQCSELEEYINAIEEMEFISSQLDIDVADERAAVSPYEAALAGLSILGFAHDAILRAERLARDIVPSAKADFLAGTEQLKVMKIGAFIRVHAYLPLLKRETAADLCVRMHAVCT